MKRAMTIGAMLCCLAVGCGVSDDEGEPVSVATNELRIMGDVAEPAVNGDGVIVTRDSSNGDDSPDYRCQRIQDECLDACNNSIALQDRVGWLLVSYRQCCDNCFAKGLACRQKDTALISSAAANATPIEPPTVR
jgi:hypothetical protein